MQKKIIALAIAGLSSTAFAQTNVTIQGLFDTGYQSFKQEAGAVTTKTNRVGSLSNSATTNLTFVVNEDLGGGMKAGLWLETDPAAGTNQAAFGGTSMWNSQNYLFVSGTAAAANGFTASSGGRDIRANNSLRYDTPTWNGFSAGLVYRSSNSGANNAADADGQTQIGLNYNNGPLNVSYTNSNIMSNVNGIGAMNTTHNLLGANYTFGTFTLMGGWTSSKNNVSPARTVDARSWNVAMKWQATPTLAVMGNILKVDDKIAATAVTGDQDRDLNALSRTRLSRWISSALSM
jgi:predicted porin